MEGCSHSLIEGIIPASAWKDCRKSRKISVKIVGHYAKIWIWNLPSMKEEY
jgi:hypothetical protein